MLKTIKTFLRGLLTGIITTVLTILYFTLRKKSFLKKILIYSRGKNEDNIYLQSSNRKQNIEKINIEERGQIRQPNGSLGERQSAMERGLQCGQLKQGEKQSRNKEREL